LTIHSSQPEEGTQHSSAKSLNDRMIYMGSADQPERPRHAPVNHKVEWS